MDIVDSISHSLAKHGAIDGPEFFNKLAGLVSKLDPAQRRHIGKPELIKKLDDNISKNLISLQEQLLQARILCIILLNELGAENANVVKLLTQCESTLLRAVLLELYVLCVAMKTESESLDTSHSVPRKVVEALMKFCVEIPWSLLAKMLLGCPPVHFKRLEPTVNAFTDDSLNIIHEMCSSHWIVPPIWSVYHPQSELILQKVLDQFDVHRKELFMQQIFTKRILNSSENRIGKVLLFQICANDKNCWYAFWNHVKRRGLVSNVVRAVIKVIWSSVWKQKLGTGMINTPRNEMNQTARLLLPVKQSTKYKSELEILTDKEPAEFNKFQQSTKSQFCHLLSTQMASWIRVTRSIRQTLPELLHSVAVRIGSNENLEALYWASDLVLQFIRWSVAPVHLTDQWDAPTAMAFHETIESMSIEALQVTCVLSLKLASRNGLTSISQLRILYRWLEHDVGSKGEESKLCHSWSRGMLSPNSVPLNTKERLVIRESFMEIVKKCAPTKQTVLDELDGPSGVVQTAVSLWSSVPENACILLIVKGADDSSKMQTLRNLLESITKSINSLSFLPIRSLDAPKSVLATWKSTWTEPGPLNTIDLSTKGDNQLSKKAKLDNWSLYLQLYELCILISSARRTTLESTQATPPSHGDALLMNRRVSAKVLSQLHKLGTRCASIRSQLEQERTNEKEALVSSIPWLAYVSRFTLSWVLAMRLNSERSSAVGSVALRVSRVAWGLLFVSSALIHQLEIRAVCIELALAACICQSATDLSENDAISFILKEIATALSKHTPRTWGTSPLGDPTAFISTKHKAPIAGDVSTPLMSKSTTLLHEFKHRIYPLFHQMHSSRESPIWYSTWHFHQLLGDNTKCSIQLLRDLAALLETLHMHKDDSEAFEQSIQHWSGTVQGIEQFVQQMIALFKSLVHEVMGQYQMFSEEGSPNNAASQSSKGSQASGYGLCRGCANVVMRLFGALACWEKPCGVLVESFPWKELLNRLRDHANVSVTVNASLVLNLVATEVLQRAVDGSPDSTHEMRRLYKCCVTNKIIPAILAVCFPSTAGNQSKTLDLRALEYALEAIKSLLLMELMLRERNELPSPGNSAINGSLLLPAMKPEIIARRRSTAFASVVKHCLESSTTQEVLQSSPDIRVFLVEMFEAHVQTLSSNSASSFRQSLMALPVPVSLRSVSNSSKGINVFISFFVDQNSKSILQNCFQL